MNLNKAIKDIIKKWDTLPKSTNDNGVFVILAERDNSGSYDNNKECLGVKKDGTLIWTYLSGCSCDGSNEEEEIINKSFKSFKIEKDKTTEEFFETHKCLPTEENYRSY